MLQQYSGVYDPEDLTVLGRIFDEAVAALPTSMQTPENRAAIATLVLARAAAGNAELASLMNLVVAIASAARSGGPSEESNLAGARRAI
ncbi:hypothetical protein AAFX91_41475 [Bradyrhizobium sp. 31Argb]|uniref:hypothetical protein n=1 Tax=Bradyrhizobium TaxID=374 RepID=UPI0018AD5A6A|nr:MULTISPECIES: hypothetical protein [Bradyrhizobium]